jgi:hypothetical protein
MKIKYLKFISVFAIAALLSACAVSVPVQEARPPQSMGNNGFSLGIISAVNPVVGPDLYQYGLENKALDASIDASLFGFTFVYGITEQLDIEFEALASLLSGSTSVLSLKYQWLGNSLFKSKRGEWVGSARFKLLDSSGYVSANDGTNEDDNPIDLDDLYFEKFDGSGYGISQLFGYHVADWFMLNINGFYSIFEVDSRFRDGGPSGTLYTDNRDVGLYGINAGLCFLPRWTHFALSFCTEMGTVSTEEAFKDNERRNVKVGAASLGFNFIF